MPKRLFDLGFVAFLSLSLLFVISFLPPVHAGITSTYPWCISGNTLTNCTITLTASLSVGIPPFTVFQPTSGPGTVSVSGTSVTGVGTAFLNTFAVGQTITVTTTAGSETKAVATISSNTVMTTASFTGTASGAPYTLTGGTRLTVLGNGNVGIGTTTPLQALDLAGNKVNDVSTVYGAGSLYLTNYSYGTATGGNINFYTANGSTSSQKAILTGAGNFGLGTTNPGSILTSTGDVFVTSSAHGVILTDSAGDCWRISVTAVTGVLTTASVSCPSF